jgi:hypothetical protein
LIVFYTLWNIAKWLKKLQKGAKKVPVTDINQEELQGGADRPIEEIDSKVAIAFGKRVAEIIVE